MVEMLVVMFVMGMMALLFIGPTYFMDQSFSSSIVEAQLEAMALNKRVSLSDSLWFNARGNINQPQRIRYKGFQCVFQLGFGRFRCE